MTTVRLVQILLALGACVVGVLALLLPSLINHEAAQSEQRTGGPTFKTRILAPLAIIAIVAAGFFARSYLDRPVAVSGQARLPQRVLSLPEGRLKVEIADSDLERERGLSDRAGLERDQGMLFLFDEPQTASFWMKDMRFSIDIVYLADGIVTQVFASVPPPGPGERPKSVAPKAPADAVLEVFAGESARRGWVPGTRLFIPAEVR